jgi:RNA polymerase sigma-54 factor
MGSIALRAEHRQQHALSPRLQQAVRLLQLSSLDFAQEVHELLGRNPFLETDETAPEPGAVPPPAADGADGTEVAADTALLGASIAAPEAAAPADAADGMHEVWQSDGYAVGARRNEDGDFGGLDTMAVETSLAEHLHGQLNVLPLSVRDLVLAKAVVESLDDDGYLRSGLDEIAELAGLEPVVTAQELQIALRRVQSLEPAGVAARSVQECLLLQLPSIADARERDLARRIVTEHLDLLAAKDVAGLARRLSIAVADVEAVCARIRRLDPRPGWRYSSAQVQYVTPDVIVRKIRGTWTAALNPAIVPRVRLNSVYADLFQRHRSAQNNELAAHLQEARWMVRNVEQRFSTILAVSQAILQRQHRFFEYGALAMKPLGLCEIAEEVGLHESTVSRVTNNKYMATPLGVFELKFFFSRAMVSASGGEFSGTAIRGLIKEMIEAEQPHAPLSDAEIARQLAAQGLVVARRTVTKYRQLLHIESVERRRRHA